MPKAEIGSTKYLNNKLKSKGLQRLRWYCQVCERQMRDENGFKMHTQSESHVRQMLLVGEDPRKYISDFSNQFQRDFLQLLRTSHGEKKVHMNHFYQEYIANKEHVHMNSTRWPSLTEFAKYLGREGICRVEENEKGLHIAWIDNSPEALRRQDAIRKKERQDKGDEEREQMLIREQVRRAQSDAGERAAAELDETDRELRRGEGGKVKLDMSGKPASVKLRLSPAEREEGASSNSLSDVSLDRSHRTGTMEKGLSPPSEAAPDFGRVTLKPGSQVKPKNVFATAKKNALGAKRVSLIEQPRKMSEAERIMKEEIERKRPKAASRFDGPAQKKQRF